MNNQNNNNYPAFSSVQSESGNPDYPSLSKVNVQESVGDMAYNAQGSQIQNKTLRKDVNYYMIGNSTNSMYDEKYDSDKSKNYIPPQPIPNQQKYNNINNNVNNSDKYNERYDSNPVKNNNLPNPNMPYPQQMPPKQKINYNKTPNCPYNSKDVNRRPPVNVPTGNIPVRPGYGVPVPVPMPVTVVPVPAIVPPPGFEPIIQLRGPVVYPPPIYPPVHPDLYPYDPYDF